MKDIFIKDLRSPGSVEGVILGVSGLNRGKDKNGNPYYDIEFIDVTGRIFGKIWKELVIALGSNIPELGKVYKVSGNLQEFRGALQISVSDMEKVKDGSYNLEDFLMRAEQSHVELESGIVAYLNRIQDAGLRSFVERILLDHKKDFYESAAAKVNHHHYVGGLAQHVLEMLNIMDSLKGFYSHVDYDLVIAGIILHDFGKVQELKRTGFSFDYTIKGKLLGHMEIICEIMERTIVKYQEFKSFAVSGKYTLLKHIILGHHGRLEYGSPVEPQTIEAEMVSKLDDVSWKMRAFTRVIEDTGLAAEQDFSKRDFAIGVPIYLKKESGIARMPYYILDEMDSDSSEGSVEVHRKPVLKALKDEKAKEKTRIEQENLL